jgi:hypothetical protein
MPHFMLLLLHEIKFYSMCGQQFQNKHKLKNAKFKVKINHSLPYLKHVDFVVYYNDRALLCSLDIAS